MSTTKKLPFPTNAVADPLSIQDIGVLLVKHYGLHEGIFEIMLQFQVGVGPVGPDPTQMMPGAMIGIQKIGLLKSKTASPSTIDASKVNPRPAQPKRKSKNIS
jgi:hypothetical protein